MCDNEVGAQETVKLGLLPHKTRLWQTVEALSLLTLFWTSLAA